MTKAKAEKRLKSWRENLDFWRERYVSIKRDKREMMDTKLAMYDYKTPRESMLSECLEEMKDIKEKIAYYQRMAL